MLLTKYLRLYRLLNCNKVLRISGKCEKINLNMTQLSIATGSLLNRRLCHITSLQKGDFIRKLSTNNQIENESLDSIRFEKVCEETLQSLTEYFEELVENAGHLKEADVSYSSGVLTINFGPPYGTYVINRQSPNKQIWLSSPTSGPKRYDFVTEGDYWVYKHDGKSLHKLLQEEIPKIVGCEVHFDHCLFSRV